MAARRRRASPRPSAASGTVEAAARGDERPPGRRRPGRDGAGRSRSTCANGPSVPASKASGRTRRRAAAREARRRPRPRARSRRRGAPARRAPARGARDCARARPAAGARRCASARQGRARPTARARAPRPPARAPAAARTTTPDRARRRRVNVAASSASAAWLSPLLVGDGGAPAERHGIGGRRRQTRGEEARGVGPAAVGERRPAGERGRVGGAGAVRRGTAGAPGERHRRSEDQRCARRAHEPASPGPTTNRASKAASISPRKARKRGYSSGAMRARATSRNERTRTTSPSALTSR